MKRATRLLPAVALCPVLALSVAPAVAADAPPTPAAVAAARSLLARGELGDVVDITPVTTDSGRTRLTIAVRKAGDGNGTHLRSVWEAETIQGAFAELPAPGRPMGDILEQGSLEYVLPDGSRLNPRLVVGFGGTATGRDFATPPRAVIEQRVSTLAASAGFTSTIRWVRGVGDAPEVTLTARELASFANFTSVTAAMFPSPSDVEGYVVDGRTPAGVSAAAFSASYRSGGFGSWVDAPVADYVHIARGGTTSPRGNLRRSDGAEIVGARWLRTGGHVVALAVRLKVPARSDVTVAIAPSTVSGVRRQFHQTTAGIHRVVFPVRAGYARRAAGDPYVVVTGRVKQPGRIASRLGTWIRPARGS